MGQQGKAWRSCRSPLVVAASLVVGLVVFTLVAIYTYHNALHAPWQIHIALLSGNSSGVTIMWATESRDTRTEVEWRLHNEGAAHMRLVQGDSSAYNHRAYSSGQLHWVELPYLQPDTLYQFRCGDSYRRVWSKEFTFRTKPATSAHIKSVTLGVVGDTGDTNDAQNVLAAMAKDSSLDMILHVGDHSYSDWEEQKWDKYGSLIEKLATKPYMGTVGNHEFYNDFHSILPYTLRYRMPRPIGMASPPKDDELGFYSFDYGPVHVVVINSEISSSGQVRWVASDLERVDRNVTPWLVVAFHTPWYNSNKAHHGEGWARKHEFEDLLLQHRVDLVVSGHVHAYERTHPVFGNQRRDGAPIYINVGTGGTHEGHAHQWLPQPDWSAMREGSSWGYGKLEVRNATHARWAWYRVEGDLDSALGDSLWLSRP